MNRPLAWVIAIFSFAISTVIVTWLADGLAYEWLPPWLSAALGVFLVGFFCGGLFVAWAFNSGLDWFADKASRGSKSSALGAVEQTKPRRHLERP